MMATIRAMNDRKLSRILPILAILFTSLISGCSFQEEERVETEYGRRRGYSHGPSVNGTAVLASIFESAGHNVHSWGTLSPRLNQADCIVWFPDDCSVPDRKSIDWFERWLSEDAGRTLIYVGRDYDAEPYYWDAVKDRVPKEDMSRWRGAKTQANNRTKAARNWRLIADPDLDEFDVLFDSDAISPGDESSDSNETPSVRCAWFVLRKGDIREPSRPLAGSLLKDSVFSGKEKLDAEKLDIRMGHRMEPTYEFDPILSTDEGRTIIAERLDSNRYYGWNHRTILVLNGSFLLNYPLVNHENRKLALRLVERIGESPRQVVFLESKRGGPEIRKDDLQDPEASSIKILTYFPINWIFIHLAAIGILYCFYRWPIFGRPRKLPAETRDDFLAHIEAVGDHLRRGGKRDIAREKLEEYHRRVGESGSGQ